MRAFYALFAAGLAALPTRGAVPQEALAALAGGDQDAAFHALRAELERDASDENVFAALVDASLLGRRPGEALAFLARLGERERRNPLPRWALGRCLRKLDRLDEAERSFREALAVQPGHVRALEEWLVVARAQGRLERALQELRPAPGAAASPARAYAVAYGHLLAYRLDAAERALGALPASVPEAELLRVRLLRERRRPTECRDAADGALATAAAWPAVSRAHLLGVRAECLVFFPGDVSLGALALARDAYRAIGDQTGEAVLSDVERGILRREARSQESLALFRRWIPVLEALGEKTDLARALANWALSHGYDYTQLADAQSAWQRALHLVREARDRREELRLLSNHGAFLVDAHRYGEAAQRFVAALELAGQLGLMRTQAVNHGNLSILYRRVGDLDRAAAQSRKSLELFRRDGDQTDVARALVDLAHIAFLRGEFREALSSFAQAERVVRLLDPQSSLDALTGVARSLAALGQAEEAARRYEEVRQRALSSGYTRAQAEASVELGELALAAGDAAGATARFEEALLAAAVSSEGIVAAIRALRGRAEARRAQGRLEAALDDYREAVGRAERLRRDVRLASLRSHYFSDKRTLYTGAVDVLFALHARQPQAGHDREALRFAELGRARTLLETLTANGPPALPAEPEQRAVLDRISRLQSTLFHGAQSAPEREALRREIEAEERRLADLELRAEAGAAPADADAEIAPLAEVAAALRPGDMLVEFLLGTPHSYVFAVAANGTLRFERLPARQGLEEKVGALRMRLERPARGLAELRADAAAAHAALLTPIAGSLAGSRRLVLVPDGILFTLPFETLLASERGSFLAESHEVVYAASASLYARRGTGESPPAPEFDLLAFGDPPRSGARPEAMPGSWSFAPLPASRREVAAVVRSFAGKRVQALLGPELGEARVREALRRGGRVTHFATHALLDEHDPGRSGIVLAGETAGAEHDGLLQAREIARLRLSADLVVLSACRSGLGTLLEGEGLLGLSRAFQLAGARSLLVSLWDVSDTSSARFMTVFYDALARGAGKAEAVREARLALLRDPNPALRHPYHWAAFVLRGAPD